MMDPRDLANIRDYVAAGIEQGMKNGASHIAEAVLRRAEPMARPKQEHFGLFGEVTVADLMAALKVLVESNTKAFNDGFDLTVRQNMAHDAAVQITAWRTVRRALGMTT